MFGNHIIDQQGLASHSRNVLYGTQPANDGAVKAFYGWRNMVSTLNDQRVRILAKTATASSICLSVICRWVTAR